MINDIYRKAFSHSPYLQPRIAEFELTTPVKIYFVLENCINEGCSISETQRCKAWNSFHLLVITYVCHGLCVASCTSEHYLRARVSTHDLTQYKTHETHVIASNCSRALSSRVRRCIKSVP